MEVTSDCTASSEQFESRTMDEKEKKMEDTMAEFEMGGISLLNLCG
jgi:hypothetical protein